jgi:hypothetical protein
MLKRIDENNILINKGSAGNKNHASFTNGAQVLWVSPITQKLLDLLEERDMEDYLMQKMHFPL